MTEAYLQILLLLAYLTIGLISVTFPIYAICVAYLPQEKWESKKERKKRIEKLKGRVAELTSELSGNPPRDSKRFKEIKRELKNAISELNTVQLRLNRLTAVGAVGLPVLALVVALVLAGVGVFFFYEELVHIGSEQIRPEQIVLFCILFSSFFSGTAIGLLYRTILAVEYAALRPARTVEFKVGFLPSWKTITRIKLRERSILRVFGKAIEDNVEDFMMYMEVPSEIETGVKARSENMVITKHPDYTLVRVYTKFLPKGRGGGFTFDVLPKKTGKYVIPIMIYGKGIFEYGAELILNVVK